MNDSINVSEWVIDLSDTSAGHAYEGHQYEVLTTQEILDLCGAMDVNAIVAASIGILLSLTCMFYLRRWRHKVKVEYQPLVDKALLTSIALLFVVVIVRIARAG